MKYKGYTGIAEIDEESGVLFGRVIGLRDVITYQGESVAELTEAFHDSVDDYLDFCATRGESPEKPFSGQFVLRLTPELHRALSHAAELENVSLNSLVESILRTAIGTQRGKPSARQRGKKGSKEAAGGALALGTPGIPESKGKRAGKAGKDVPTKA
jgi:predicted HicB family RNase H-like nuclease